MEKVLLIVFMVLVVGVIACGQQVHYKNEATPTKPKDLRDSGM